MSLPRATPPRSDRAGRRSRGARGEALAAAALRRAGWRIVAHHLRTAGAEIDLLARRGRTYAAVEVKTRAGHPAPERTVRGAQFDRIERALQTLAGELRPTPHILRIDIVAVRWQDGGLPELLHFPAVRQVAPPDRGNATRGRPPLRPRESPISEYLALPLLPPPMPTLAEQIFPRRKLLLIASESVILTALLFAGTNLPPFGVPNGIFGNVEELLRTIASCAVVAAASQIALSYNDLYDWRVSQNRAELPNRLVYALGHALVVVALLIIAAPTMFHFPGIAAETGKTYRLIVVMAASFAVLFAWRVTFHWFFYKWRFGEQVLILGNDTSAQQIGQMIAENPLSGFELVGIVAEDEQTPLAPGEEPWKRVLGRIRDLPELCARHGIARVLVCLRERRGKVPVEALLDVRMNGILVEEREAMYERLAGKLAIESMRPSYLIYNQGFGKHPTTLAIKRFMDVALSVIGLVLSMPVCLFATVAILTTSRGPLFFVQERVGQDGKVFRLVKFRTMRPDAEKETGPVWAKVDDDRITPVGRFLRITRIDEIQQFLNVLAGHMSFVGPRPERPHFVAQLTKQLPFYPLRHTVKPGLTGWAQVRLEYGASVEDAMEKLRYDLYYLKNMSPLFDINIVLRTIGVIVLGKGAR